MRMVKPVQVLWTLALAAVVLLPLAGVAFANVNDVSIERSGSIIVFPKVVWDGTRDTIIQIANTSNNMLHARCFYVNAISSPGSPPQCFETDFDIWLTRQQPTHWVVSEGRSTFVLGSVYRGGDPVDESGGFSPGLIPPVTRGFIGELKCVQVDASDVPLRSNALKGEATIRSLDGDVSEYNAVAFQGNPDMTLSEGDPNDLLLDLTATHLGEYSACPDTLLFNHFAEGASDPVISQLGSCTGACTGGPTPGATCTSDTVCGTGGVCNGLCPLSTELTLVPCSQNLENQVFGNVTVQFVVFNEFENQFSTSTTVSCFLNLPLDEIGATGKNPFTFRVLGSLGAYARINPNPGNGGLIGVAEEFRSATTAGVPGPAAAAIFNLHTEGNRFDAASNGKGQLLNCPTPGQAPCATDQIIVPEP